LILSLLIRISIVIILLFIGEIKGYLIIFLKIFLKMNQLTGFPAFILKKMPFSRKKRKDKCISFL